MATSRFLPPFTPQLFPGTSSANHLPPPPPFIPAPFSSAPSFPFPALINDGQQQQQAIAFGNALSFFSEIFRKQQQEAEDFCTFENGPENEGRIATLEEQHNSANGPSVSDEQIDRILDEMMMGREGNRRGENQIDELEGEQNGQQQHLCILPIPIFVPIPLPVGTDFILKHYCGKSKMSKKA